MGAIVKAGAVLSFAPISSGQGYDPFALQEPERHPCAIHTGPTFFQTFGAPCQGDTRLRDSIRDEIVTSLFDGTGRFDPARFVVGELGLSPNELDAIENARRGLTDQELDSLVATSPVTREQMRSLAEEYGLSAVEIRDLIATHPGATWQQMVDEVRLRQGMDIEQVIRDGKGLSDSEYGRLMAKSLVKPKTSPLNKPRKEETEEDRKKREKDAEKISVGIGRHIPCTVKFELTPPSMRLEKDTIRTDAWDLGEIEIQVMAESSIPCTISGTGMYVGLRRTDHRSGESGQTHEVWKINYSSSGMDFEEDGSQGIRPIRRPDPFEITVSGKYKTASVRITPEFSYRKIDRPYALVGEKEVYRKGMIVELYPEGDEAMTGDDHASVEVIEKIVFKSEYRFIDPETRQPDGGVAFSRFRTEEYTPPKSGNHFKKVDDFERGEDPTEGGKIVFVQ
ncbi:MAG: hypothetical protein HQM01_10085 [Magnetococcales bacterium]|nr:hypothetical protein [Magnetococcales bacterium]